MEQHAWKKINSISNSLWAILCFNGTGKNSGIPLLYIFFSFFTFVILYATVDRYTEWGRTNHMGRKEIKSSCQNWKTWHITWCSGVQASTRQWNRFYFCGKIISSNGPFQYLRNSFCMPQTVLKPYTYSEWDLFVYLSVMFSNAIRVWHDENRYR